MQLKKQQAPYNKVSLIFLPI